MEEEKNKIISIMTLFVLLIIGLMVLRTCFKIPLSTETKQDSQTYDKI